MATNPAKGTGQPAAKTGAPSSPPVNAAAPEDRKLAKFVREHAQPLIACLLDAAATAGENRDYPKMHEWRQLGNELATLSGGVPAATSTTGGSSKPAATMAASA